MIARMKTLGRYGDLVALIAALTIIAAMASKAPPATPAGDWRAASNATCASAPCPAAI